MFRITQMINFLRRCKQLFIDWKNLPTRYNEIERITAPSNAWHLTMCTTEVSPKVPESVASANWSNSFNMNSTCGAVVTLHVMSGISISSAFMDRWPIVWNTNIGWISPSSMKNFRRGIVTNWTDESRVKVCFGGYLHGMRDIWGCSSITRIRSNRMHVSFSYLRPYNRNEWKETSTPVYAWPLVLWSRMISDSW